MADPGIKKATVKKQDLPPVNSSNGYLVRYRVISEDRNRYSHWSPIAEISANSPHVVDGRIVNADDIVNVVWGDEAGYPDYDVFVGFDSAIPTYHGTTSVHSYSFINTGTTQIDVIIQIASSAKVVNNTLEIYSETVLI